MNRSRLLCSSRRLSGSLIEIVNSHERDIPENVVEFVQSRLPRSLSGTESNKVLAVMLGGSHSKHLQNSRSDVDLILYYTTTAKNLISFNRETLSVVPKGFIQVKTEPVLYEYRGLEYELDMVPVRRVGEGNDLFTNLKKNNMKTIFDLLKDYRLPLGLPTRFPAERDFERLVTSIIEGEFQISIESVMGFFQGYMTSQLISHRRHKDFDKRMERSLADNEVDPIVKMIMNGMYIGLSGLFLLDRLSVSRDFYPLWKGYEYLFSDEEREFIETCYRHKTDKEHVTRKKPFLDGCPGFRESIFQKMCQQFDISKETALKEGRFKVEIDQRKQNDLLDQFQYKFLEV